MGACRQAPSPAKCYIGAMSIRQARIAALAALGIAVLALAAGYALWHRNGGAASGSQSAGLATIGGPFSLTDQNGRTVTDQDFRGKFMLVYFGYTFCPDACPTALLQMGQALDRLGADGDQVQPVFVTIDPERDTVEQLKTYAGNFHPRLEALTGTPQQIAQAAKAYRVYYARAADSGSTDYLMDHTSIIYLIGRDGRYLTHFTHQSTTDQIVAGIRKYL
jgi:protein SCO1/2